MTAPATVPSTRTAPVVCGVWSEAARVVLFLAIVATASCTPFVAIPLDPVASADQLASRSLHAEDLHAFLIAQLGHPLPVWPLPSWDLETLAIAAFFYSPELDLARARVGATDAAQITAAARPNPTLGFIPERAAHNEGMPSPWIATLSLDVPIETAGKRGYRIARAASVSEAARMALGATAWRVRSRLRDALLEREAALARHRLMQERVAIQEEVARLYLDRIAAGAASRVDAAPTRLALEQARMEESHSSTEVEEATAEVAVAIGIPASALNGVELRVRLDTPPAMTLSVTEARHRAMLQRADVLGALSDFAASESALQLEVARQYPDVHLGTGYQYDQGNEKWSVGLTVDVPVLNRNQGPIAEAEAARREAVAHFVATQASALAEVDAAVASKLSAEAKLERAHSTRATANTQIRRLSEARRAGAADVLDVKLGSIDAIDAALMEVDAQLAFAKACAKVEDAVQSPIPLNLETTPLGGAMASAVLPAKSTQ